MNINNITSILGNVLLTGMNESNMKLLDAFTKLSTGKRINSASDDAAGLSIATRLESQVRGLAMAERNAQMAISKIQTAEGYAGSATEDLQRINELSVQAANGTLNQSDREAIQMEIDQLRENIDFTFSTAEFNSTPIFSGTTDSYQIGADSSSRMEVFYPAMSSASLGLDTIDVTTQSGAENAISITQDAMDDVLSARTEFGASQNRLESALNTISQTRIDTLSALSEIMDANIALEVMNSMQAMNSLESQVLLMSQVKNLEGGLLTRLLG